MEGDAICKQFQAMYLTFQTKWFSQLAMKLVIAIRNAFFKF